MRRHLLLLLAATACLAATCALAAEHVKFRRDDREIEITGRLLVKAEDDGLLVQTPDGVLWNIQPEELIEHQTDEEDVPPLSSEELGRRLLAELPDGFETYETQHYLICYNTSKAYAQWCGSLFERLYKGFHNFWSRKNFDLHEPEFPLVAIVHADRASYTAYVKRELGAASDLIDGYYSFQSNRMTTHDLTGIEGLRGSGDRRGSSAEINAMLARPEAEHNVATVIHEATHQIAFNCGLHSRYADIPVWFSEGFAMYFETPDLNNSKGWRNIGSLNYGRLNGFREYLRRRPADSLITLVSSDDRVRSPSNRGDANDAYAESWALHYFLIRSRPRQYLTYLQMLSKKEPCVWDEPEERLAEFKQAFGDDLEQLDAEFVRQMSKLR